MKYDRVMYQQALDSQSACNLSGLAHALASSVTKIWDEARAANEGTEYVNAHPVVALYLHQMAYLSGTCHDLLGEAWKTAHDICTERATVPVEEAQ